MTRLSSLAQQAIDAAGGPAPAGLSGRERKEAGRNITSRARAVTAKNVGSGDGAELATYVVEKREVARRYGRVKGDSSWV